MPLPDETTSTHTPIPCIMLPTHLVPGSISFLHLLSMQWYRHATTNFGIGYWAMKPNCSIGGGLLLSGFLEFLVKLLEGLSQSTLLGSTSWIADSTLPPTLPVVLIKYEGMVKLQWT